MWDDSPRLQEFVRLGAAAPGGLRGSVLVAAICLAITLLLWGPLSLPAGWINAGVKWIMPRSCETLGLLTNICTSAAGLMTWIGSFLVLGGIYLFRRQVSRALTPVANRLPADYRFLGAPVLGTILFIIVWAGNSFHWWTRPGLVRDGLFPVVVGLLTHLMFWHGPGLQRRLAALLQPWHRLSPKVRIGLGFLAMYVIALLLGSSFSPAVSDQMVVIVGLVFGYLLLAPRSGAAALVAVAAVSFLLLPKVAEARACADFLFSSVTCERAHHAPLFGLTGSALAVLTVLVLNAGYSDLFTNLTRPARGDGSPAPPVKPPPPPTPSGPPPLIDPWTGEGLIVQDGSYVGGEPGQVWYDRWVDRAEAIVLIEDGRRAIARRDAQREEFWDESQRLSGEWLKNRTAQLEAEAAAEKRERERWESAWTSIENIDTSAYGRGYDDILDRLDNAFNEDGTLNVEYVEALSRATRNRIGRDMAAPDETLSPDWLGEALTETGDDLIHNPLVRIGLGVATSGSSEIFFQSLAAHEALQRQMQEAIAKGEDFTYTDSFRTAAGALARENLPVNTYEALQDPNASGWQVAMGLATDAFVAVDGINTVRNVRGSLNQATHGGGLGATLTHQADPVDLLGPFRGDPDAPLWKQPTDIEWHTSGPSVQHVGGSGGGRPVRVAGQGKVDGLPPDVRAQVNRVQTVQTRDPVGQLEDSAFRRGRSEGLNKVERLDQAHRDLDSARFGGDPQAIAAAEGRVRSTTLEVQKDKNAIHTLNDRARAAQEGAPAGSTVHDPSVEQFNKNIDEIYNRTDEGVFAKLSKDPDVPGTEIRAKKVTNVKDPGELKGPAKDKASYDRDVTYEVKKQVRGPDGKMTEVWEDVPAHKVEQVYNEEFWKASTGDPPPARPDGSLDHEAMARHAKEMDQTVTDARHSEAYGAGQADLETATQDPFRHRDLIDPQQVGDAVTYKVDHWLDGSDQAAKSGDMVGAVTNLEEAQRQLIKQTDNMVLKRTDAMASAGNAPGAAVPQAIRVQTDVLKLVDDGILTPSQAESVLESMGTSTAQAASGTGDYVAGLQVLRRSGW